MLSNVRMPTALPAHLATIWPPYACPVRSVKAPAAIGDVEVIGSKYLGRRIT